MAAKGMEDAHIGHAMPMGQSGKSTPSALLGQHRREQIERMHRRQQRQQMHPPKLGSAELPVRTTRRTDTPMVVDEIVGNIRVQQVEQATGARQRKTLHGAGGYLFATVAPDF